MPTAPTPTPERSRERLSPETRAWLEGTDPADRKRLGQYMTPRPVRERLLDLAALWPGMRVLDPGVGTGELLAAVIEREPGAQVTGWDVDDRVLEVAAARLPGARLRNRSALDPVGPGDGGFDLVIGNPPYFQFKPDPSVRERFAEVISGRPNMFAFFFKAGLDALAAGGRLAYVVPPSMNNGAYFESLRRAILARGEVESLVSLPGSDQFEGANTAVQLISIRRRGSSGESPLAAGRHVLCRECGRSGFRRTIFSPDAGGLAAEFEGRRTLDELGYEAVTGTVVWNRERESLRDGACPGAVRLIWAHDIGRGELLGRRLAGKPGFALGRAPVRGPAIVVNRVVGAVGEGRLRCAPIRPGEEFVGENHVNVIRAREGARPAVGWEELLRALLRPELAGRLRALTGNTQISATELTHLLPLDA